MILIILPFSSTHISGGSIYNRHVVTALVNQFDIRIEYIDGSFPFVSDENIELIQGLINSEPDLVIMDGIMSEALVSLEITSSIILIMHNKLSRGREYTSQEKERLVEVENIVIDKIRSAITPSIRWQNQSEIESYLVYPGSDGPFDSTISIDTARDKRRLLFIANISPIKNLELVLELLSRLEHYQLYIVGSFSDKVYEVSIKDRIQVLGITERVQLIGNVSHSDLSQYYLKSSFLLISSYTESYGIVIGEALYAGLPVIMPDLEIPNFLKSSSIVVEREVNAYLECIRKYENDEEYARLCKNISSLKSRLPIWHEMEKQIQEIVGEYIG